MRSELGSLGEGGVVIRTPDQRLRVFVSSTLGELAPERRAVARAISSLRLTPVLFGLGARPHPPRDLAQHIHNHHEELGSDDDRAPDSVAVQLQLDSAAMLLDAAHLHAYGAGSGGTPRSPSGTPWSCP
jgi:hypothetical protein